MEGGIDKDCSALGMLFQTIINDMRVSEWTSRQYSKFKGPNIKIKPPFFCRVKFLSKTNYKCM